MCIRDRSKSNATDAELRQNEDDNVFIKKAQIISDEYKQKYQLNFSVLATPAEGLSGRFTRMDRRKYGIIPGVTDNDYYVNSFHVDVKEPITCLLYTSRCV